MHADRPPPARYSVAGLVAGMAAGIFAQRNPEWVLRHPGTIGLGALALLVLAGLVVQHRMNRAEREHQARAESFRLSMLAQFAPELLERELAGTPG